MPSFWVLAVSVVCNVALPAAWFLALSRLTHWEAVTELAIGLAAPVCYGVASLITARRLSALSILSLLSITLTGAFGFFAIDRTWFTAKAATIPLIISIGILSQRGRVVTLLRALMTTLPFVDGDAIERALSIGDREEVASRILLDTANLLAAHFLFNAVLNVLATWMIVTNDPGTVAFNEQFGELQLRGIYLVALPCTISISLIGIFTALRLSQLTGLGMTAVLRLPARQKLPAARDSSSHEK